MPKSKKVQQLHTTRQRPISCRFCRSRKLRCDREVPCSNCVSRSIHCELEHPSPSRSSRSATSLSESELLERIRRLETLVENGQSNQLGVERQHCSADLSEGDLGPQEPRETALPAQLGHLDSDVSFLESIYSGNNVSDKVPLNKVIFRTCPIQNILRMQPYVNQYTGPSSLYHEPLRCVWLPQYAEAKILLDKFINEIEFIHHVVHVPSVPSILSEVYACIDQQGQVNAGNVLLIMSIFASSTQYWVQKDCEDSNRGLLFATCAEAHNQSAFWIKTFEDVLDIAHRTASLSIEGIQGIIIASFALLNIEGFSRRCRFLWSLALLLARELGLHCVDHPSNAALAHLAETEMKRRVWWYLVTTDWLSSLMFGSVNKGVYQCSIRHMIVKKPLNINDEDLIDGIGQIEHPMSQPTSMSYSLYRIRLAEVARSFTDRTSLITMRDGGPGHDIVMDIDTQLQTLVNDAPRFFSMSIPDLIETYHLSTSRAASIAYQGYTFFTLVHTQRCAIHLPYFNLGFADPTYAVSRDMCLQSARLIIKAKSPVKDLGFTSVTRYRCLGLLLPILIASIVLLVDLCHANKSSSSTITPQRQKQREEIADALRILEEARYESKKTANFLDSLMNILRKHKVAPPKPAVQLVDSRIVQSSPTALGVEATTETYRELISASLPMDSTDISSGTNDPITFSNNNTSGEDLSSYFNELAESFEQGMDASSFDWNNILLSLDPLLV